MSPREKFDAIVVGAGPSGNTAAYTLAKAGLKVLQIERGEYPGSKNVQGAILYADALERVIPDFRDDAPLERHVIEQRVWVLDDNSFVGTHYRSDDYNKPPYNRYTIIRAQFDKWFSAKVREAGALLICETTVEELLMDGKRCIGVRCDRQGGEVHADVVILADGVNSTLARKAGFQGFGFYPRSGFIHIDLGPARSWGERFPVRAVPFVAETPPAREVLAVNGGVKPGHAAAQKSAS